MSERTAALSRCLTRCWGLSSPAGRQERTGTTRASPVLEVIRRLKDIAARIKQYEGAGGSASACNGTVSAEKDGLIRAAVGSDGKLQPTCG